MKTFLNVLYRRILYKIPLKLLLILVAVFGVLFACFSSALTLNSAEYPGQFDFHLRSIEGDVDISPTLKGITCVNLDRESGGTFYDGENTYSFSNWNTYCTDSDTVILHTNGHYAYYWYFFGETFMKKFYPDYTSLQCQTEYNLIPISSVDSSYCEENNLCSSSDCPGGDLTPGVSNIFINDIFHPGAFNVIMNIPQEIDWDYAYTNSGQNLNIDVVGFNVDYEKMQSVIDNQNFKPSSEDLSLIVSTIIPLFVPGLVILLFLYFAFRFIKKIF